MNIKFYLKKLQLYDIYGNPIRAVGTTPNNIVIENGVMPDNEWRDITDDVDDLVDFSITFTERRDEDGADAPGVTFVQKGVAGTITVSGATYKFMKDWIYDSPSSVYNSFSLKIEDVGCGVYDEFVINRTSISFTEGDICTFECNARQDNEPYACIQRTVISDNWQGWFQDEPQPQGRLYPRFSYCKEPQNTWQHVIAFQMFTSLYSLSAVMVFIFGTILNPILWILGLIEDLFGANWNIPDPITAKGMTEIHATLLMEGMGCGREIPAAFIRDYIENVCLKCGIHVDEHTVPYFFAKTISMTTSMGEIKNEHNPHYYATWFAPIQRKGIRRLRSLMSNLKLGNPDTTTFYQSVNKPIYALSDFLDILKGVYNAEWKIKTVNGKPTLYFLRKDKFYNSSYAYNFEEGSPDRDKILKGVTFEPREVKRPAMVDGLYAPDPMDPSTSNVNNEYNGLAYNFGQATDTNPLFYGSAIKNKGVLAPTKFGQDGSTNDYVYDTFQNGMTTSYIFGITIGITMNPFAILALNQLFKQVAEYIEEYAKHAIYMRSDTVTIPRIIIWDGVRHLNARAENIIAGRPDPYNGKPTPVANTTYNTTNFDILHPRETNGASNGNRNSGLYGDRFFTAWNPVNSAMMSSALCSLPNWPMYLNPGFKGTLWDWFWFIEDPRFRTNLGKDWSVEIENCCEDLNKLGVFGNIEDIAIGKIVKLPIKYNFDGVIEEIEVNYKTDPNVGRTIRISGTV